MCVCQATNVIKPVQSYTLIIPLKIYTMLLKGKYEFFVK